MVETCAYHDADKPKILRDQIVMNIVSDTVREKLLGESGLRLEKAVDMYRSMEATTQYLTCMEAPSTTTNECDSEAASAHAIRESKAHRQALCYYCATRHEPRDCPAWDKRCSYCSKLNHAAEACKKAEKRNAGLKRAARRSPPIQ